MKAEVLIKVIQKVINHEVRKVIKEEITEILKEGLKPTIAEMLHEQPAKPVKQAAPIKTNMDELAQKMKVPKKSKFTEDHPYGDILDQTLALDDKDPNAGQSILDDLPGLLNESAIPETAQAGGSLKEMFAIDSLVAQTYAEQALVAEAVGPKAALAKNLTKDYRKIMKLIDDKVKDKRG